MARYLVCLRIPEPNLYKVEKEVMEGVEVTRAYPDPIKRHHYLSPKALELSYREATEAEVLLYA